MNKLPDTSENAKTGNRCGFQPGRWRLWCDGNGPAALPFLGLVQRSVTRVLDTNDPWFFAGRRRQRRSDREVLGDLHDKLPRGERREAMADVSQFLLQYMQVKTMKVQVFATGAGVAVATIAARTGLSINRVKGALADMASCGFIGGYQRRDKTSDGGYRGHVAVRWFTSRFFKLVGVWRAFIRLRKVLRLPAPRDSAADDATTGFIVRAQRQRWNRPRVV